MAEENDLYSIGEPYRMEDIESVRPNFPGVYCLYEGAELIYIGSSTDQTVEARLVSHRSGEEGECAQDATAFSAGAVYFPGDPIERERDLLRRYHMVHQRLPRCNDIMP